MRIIVLGAAAGGGFPQWNSTCPVGARAWRHDPAASWRNQCSLAVSVDGERWALLNAAPELRHQILATPALHPRHGPRHSPIEAVLLTNGDVDHVAGLLSLRESQPFALYATPAIQAVLAANPIFNVLNPAFVERRTIALEAPMALLPGLQVRPFAVPGKVALYLEQADLALGQETEDTIGLEILTETGRRWHFLPGCAVVTDRLLERLAGSDLLFFDGTLWQDDEMVKGGTGQKTGARMGHISIAGEHGSLARLAGAGVARKIYLHINNTNPILLDDSAERRMVEAAGWEVAYDGLEVLL